MPSLREKPRRLPELVADHIESMVFSEELSAGDQLPTEAQLVEDFDVSRTVVREAARILEQRGLVQIRPGSGMVVAKVDSAPVARHYALLMRANPSTWAELMEVRLLFETQITGLAALNRSVEDLQALDASLESARQHIDDYEVALLEDANFHSVVSRACGNSIMATLVDPINESLGQIYRAPMKYLASLPSTIREHQAIADAIRAGDEVAARAASTAHLQRIRASFADLIADGDHAEAAN
ncbi:MAG: FadR family transcriptional regulator [Propionibacteriaceae bacterium]|jgi:DNA-binding FadR family transcriptional regulator|nr:FadR family transcriptional regulator [Propionibacteriaceae bacterium]